MAQYSSYGWWGAEASAPRGLGGMTNQYAAMPSLHVGWALWCGVMLWRHGRTPLVKAAGVAYPLVTTIVVMGTANHYFLDAVAGAAVMGVGLLLTRPVMRLADRVKAAARAPALRTGPRAPGASHAQVPRLSVRGCQTSAGERIPRPADLLRRLQPMTPNRATPQTTALRQRLAELRGPAVAAASARRPRAGRARREPRLRAARPAGRRRGGQGRAGDGARLPRRLRPVAVRLHAGQRLRGARSRPTAARSCCGCVHERLGARRRAAARPVRWYPICRRPAPRGARPVRRSRCARPPRRAAGRCSTTRCSPWRWRAPPPIWSRTRWSCTPTAAGRSSRSSPSR